MSTMNASVIIRFLTEGTQKVRQQLNTISKGAKDLKRGFSQAIRQGLSANNIDTAMRNAEARLTRARGRLLDAVGMAAALAAPIRAANTTKH